MISTLSLILAIAFGVACVGCVVFAIGFVYNRKKSNSSIVSLVHCHSYQYSQNKIMIEKDKVEDADGSLRVPPNPGRRLLSVHAQYSCDCV